MEDSLTFLATTYDPAFSGRIDKHLVGYSTIQLMTEGRIHLRYDDTVRELEGGWFWPAHPGPRIAFYPAPGTHSWFHRHVGFCGPRVDRWMAEGLWPQGAQPLPPGKDWGAIFDDLIRQTRRTGDWAHLRAVNMLEGMLLELAQARAETPRSPAVWLVQVQEQLARPSAFSPDYGRIAAAGGMGIATLRRRFKTATGMTMQDYVLHSRLTEARALLTDTDLPLKTISERLGYDTVYFFARQFRHQVGVPPGAYRRSRQK